MDTDIGIILYRVSKHLKTLQFNLHPLHQSKSKYSEIQNAPPPCSASDGIGQKDTVE